MSELRRRSLPRQRWEKRQISWSSCMRTWTTLWIIATNSERMKRAPTVYCWYMSASWLFVKRRIASSWTDTTFYIACRTRVLEWIANLCDCFFTEWIFYVALWCHWVFGPPAGASCRIGQSWITCPTNDRSELMASEAKLQTRSEQMNQILKRKYVCFLRQSETDFDLSTSDIRFRNGNETMSLTCFKNIWYFMFNIKCRRWLTCKASRSSGLIPKASPTKESQPTK